MEIRRQEVSDGDTQNKPARNLCLFYAQPMENRTKDRVSEASVIQGSNLFEG